MVYEFKDILRDVRIAIDENKTNEQLITDEDIDTLMLDDIIYSKVVEGVRRTVTNAPIHLLDGGVPFGDAVYWRNQHSGWVMLPDDFMRLMVFKMSDWERPVYEPITAGDPRYQLQFSRYKGLRGNPQKPVVAIVSRTEGRVLELYSCNDDTATVEQSLYYPLPSIDDNEGIMIPERCYQSAIYQMAALVLATIGQREQSQVMTDLSKQLLV